MAQEVSLQAEPREGTGKGPGRRLRMQGRIPAVVYGLQKDSRSVSVDAHQLDHLIGEFGEHALIALDIAGGGKVEHVITRDSQRDPVTGRLVHADFYRIDPKKPIHIQIPVQEVGTPLGVREGGILEELLREIDVRCLPTNMPAYFEVDVSNLEIGDSLHASDLTPPAGVEVLTPPDTAIFTVLAPRLAEELEAEGEEEAAEPEVVGEKGEGEEEEEGEDKRE